MISHTNKYVIILLDKNIFVPDVFLFLSVSHLIFSPKNSAFVMRTQRLLLLQLHRYDHRPIPLLLPYRRLKIEPHLRFPLLPPGSLGFRRPIQHLHVPLLRFIKPSLAGKHVKRMRIARASIIVVSKYIVTAKSRIQILAKPVLGRFFCLLGSLFLVFAIISIVIPRDR